MLPTFIASPGVTMKREMAEKRTGIALVRVQLRTEDSIRTKDAQVGFRNPQHSDKWGREVHPASCPYMREHSRPHSARGVDAEAGNRSKEQDVNGNQHANSVARVESEMRPVRRPKNYGPSGGLR